MLALYYLGKLHDYYVPQLPSCKMSMMIIIVLALYNCYEVEMG